MKLVREILDTLDEPMCVLSRELVLLEANKSFLELISVSEVKDCNLGVLWPSLNEDCRKEGRFSTSWFSYSGEVITVRGVVRLSEENIIVRIDASANPDGTIVQDHHKQRIETLGMLAGGVAHDFNNVLTGVLGHVAFLKHKVEQPGDAFDSLLAIEDGALRGSDLVKQILLFSRLDTAEAAKPIDMERTCHGVATLLKSAIPSRIGVSVQACESVPKVLATEAQINQILINLIINARDAIDGEGSIQVRIGGQVSAAEMAKVSGNDVSSEVFTSLQVQDTGSGMSADLIDQIFEPYFSTKERAGTGLGLSTVREIVGELGGAIEVQSEVGLGTTFEVLLPVFDEESSDDSSVGIPNLRRGSGQRILVIDDEDAVRNVLSLSLSHLGYSVDVASSGLQGLEKLQDAQHPYSLIMLDVLMPEMPGDQVFDIIRERRVETPVLVMSGFSSEHIVERMRSDGARGFIRKPFSIETLSQRVEEIVGDKVI
jgi:two-component system cell cycle sensor histidine kinase/response regulator CckA